MRSRDAASSWRLYVDETGSFDGTPGSAVVGLLLRHQDHFKLDQAMRAAITNALPEVTWPLHTTYLAHTAYLLREWKRSTPDRQRLSPISQALQDAWTALKRSQSADIQEYIAAVENPRAPTWEAYANVSTELRRLNSVLDASLTNRLQQASESLRQIIEALERTHCHTGMMVVVGAAEESTVMHSVQSADRYMSALELMIERVFALLRSRPAALTLVRGIFAKRDVWDPELKVQRALHITQAQSVIRRAEQRPPDAPKTPTRDVGAHLIADQVVDYRTSQFPGLVLVDFIANRVYKALKHRPNQSWDLLCETVRRTTSTQLMVLPAMAPQVGEIPTVACPDPARAQLQRWFAHDDSPMSAGPSRLWARESSALLKPWVDAVR